MPIPPFDPCVFSRFFLAVNPTQATRVQLTSFLEQLLAPLFGCRQRQIAISARAEHRGANRRALGPTPLVLQAQLQSNPLRTRSRDTSFLFPPSTGSVVEQPSRVARCWRHAEQISHRQRWMPGAAAPPLGTAAGFACSSTTGSTPRLHTSSQQTLPRGGECVTLSLCGISISHGRACPSQRILGCAPSPACCSIADTCRSCTLLALAGLKHAACALGVWVHSNTLGCTPTCRPDRLVKCCCGSLLPRRLQRPTTPTRTSCPSTP
jgi:hypothetical protein